MRGLSRRQIIIGAGLIPAYPAAFIKAAVAQTTEAPPALEKLYAAAKQEGHVTWYVSTMTAETANAVAKRFGELYPGVRADVTRLTAETAFQRVAQELKAGAPQADVLTTADVSQFVTLGKQGELLRYTPDSVKTMIDNPLIRQLDPEGYYHVTTAYLLGMAYNTAKVNDSDAPQKWVDFIDPKWINQVSVSHPAFSGIAGLWAIEMKKLYGEQFFAKLAANQPFISRSNIDATVAVASGERLIGTAADHIVLGLQKKGNPIKFAVPTEGAVLEVGITGAFQRSPRLNATKLFLEFIHSPEMSRLMVADFQASLHPDVPPAPGITPLDQAKFIIPTPAEVVADMPGIVSLWHDQFGI